MHLETSGTLIGSGSERLKSLARAVGFDEASVRAMQEVFRTLSASWGQLPAGGPPAWPSDACDDHSPFELSLAVDARGPQVRALVEPMDAPYTLEAQRAAARRLYPVLARDYGINLERLRALDDLLVPANPKGRFALWYAVGFLPGQAPEFKAYFNLHVQGPGRAATLTQEALQRLGFAKAWPALAETLRRREDGAEDFVYLALDLSHDAEARVKVYLRHTGATAAELDALCGVAVHHKPGSVVEFCRQLAGHEGPYYGKGPVTCFTLTTPSSDRPCAATFYFPVSHHTRDDRESRQRVTEYLTSQQLETAPYLGALEACARRPLEAGSSLHTYAALRSWHAGTRVTAYFSPEIFGHQPPRGASSPRVAPPPRPATDIVSYYEAHSIADHPFLARLRREPVDLSKLARVMVNFRAGITQDFPRRLAMLTARAPDDHLRCILAKQLNDEMGNGDFSRAHRGLFERMIGVLRPWLPADLVAATAPGRKLGETLEHCYVRADPYEGIGASLVVEVYGKQVDSHIADEFRRQSQIPPSELEWLHLHETLEVEHADESLDMARLVPEDPAAREAAWRGARAVASASRVFFDALYAECFE
jgi:DMATS type aromatic prenyltransferase